MKLICWSSSDEKHERLKLAIKHIETRLRHHKTISEVIINEMILTADWFKIMNPCHLKTLGDNMPKIRYTGEIPNTIRKHGISTDFDLLPNIRRLLNIACGYGDNSSTAVFNNDTIINFLIDQIIKKDK